MWLVDLAGLRVVNLGPAGRATVPLRVSRQDGTATVRAVGDLDLATVLVLKDQRAASATPDSDG